MRDQNYLEIELIQIFVWEQDCYWPNRWGAFFEACPHLFSRKPRLWRTRMNRPRWNYKLKPSAAIDYSLKAPSPPACFFLPWFLLPNFSAQTKSTPTKTARQFFVIWKNMPQGSPSSSSSSSGFFIFCFATNKTSNAICSQNFRGFIMIKRRTGIFLSKAQFRVPLALLLLQTKLKNHLQTIPRSVFLVFILVYDLLGFKCFH